MDIYDEITRKKIAVSDLSVRYLYDKVIAIEQEKKQFTEITGGAE